MRVAIIGTGNIAKSFCRALQNSNVKIEIIIGRSLLNTKNFAHDMNVSYSLNLNDLPRDLDIYFCCVNDDALPLISKNFPFDLKKEQVIVHFSGSVPSTIFQSRFPSFGVVWPIESVHPNTDWNNMTIVATYSSPFVQKSLRLILDPLTKNVIEKSDEKRVRMHLVAVILNNFTYHLISTTKQYCEENEISFDAYSRILNTTFESIKDENSDMQTGPARRNDMVTIQHHMELLSETKALAHLYNCLSKSILEKYENIR